MIHSQIQIFLCGILAKNKLRNRDERTHFAVGLSPAWTSLLPARMRTRALLLAAIVLVWEIGITNSYSEVLRTDVSSDFPLSFVGSGGNTTTK